MMNKALFKIVTTIIAAIVLSICAFSAETVIYENDFSDPASLWDFTQYRLKWEVRDGGLYMTDEPTESAGKINVKSDFGFILYNAPAKYDNYVVDVDLMNANTQTGVIVRAQQNLAKHKNSAFVGYIAFVSQTVNQGALGAGTLKGEWAGVVNAGALHKHLYAGTNLHFNVIVKDQKIGVKITNIDSDKLVYDTVYNIGSNAKYDAIFTAGTFGFRMRAMYDDAHVAVGNSYFDNLVVTTAIEANPAKTPVDTSATRIDVSKITPVYTNTFDDASALDEFYQLYGTWEVIDGKLYLTDVEDASSALILYDGKEKLKTLKDYVLDIDMYNVQTQAGAIVRSDINAVKADHLYYDGNDFFGYIGYSAFLGNQAAIGYGTPNGGWGGLVNNTKSPVDIYKPTANIHLQVAAKGTTIQMAVSEIGGSTLWVGYTKHEWWEEGTFGLRFYAKLRDDGLYNVSNTAFDNLVISTFPVDDSSTEDDRPTDNEESKPSMVFVVGSKIAHIDGMEKILDVAPYFNNGEIMVPARFWAEHINAGAAWDEATQTFYIYGADTTVAISVGAKTAIVNGETVDVLSPLTMVDECLMISAHFVAEAFEYEMFGDSDDDSLYINCTSMITVTSEFSKVMAGEEETITVFADPNLGFSGAEFNIFFDNEILTLLSIDTEGAIADFATSSIQDANASGKIVFSYKGDINISKNGKIASLSFRVDDVEVKQTTKLLFDFSKENTYYYNGQQREQLNMYSELGNIYIDVKTKDSLWLEIVDYIDADEDYAVNTVVLSNGWEIAAKDINIGEWRSKYTYLGLPVKVGLSKPANEFIEAYANGEACITLYMYPEYTKVINCGEGDNIRYVTNTEEPYIYIGSETFHLTEYDLILYTFNEDGWTEQSAEECNRIINMFAYDGGYTGDASTCNTYCQMSYRVVETDSKNDIVEILYTPYEFGQYIERNFRYAPTGTTETFAIIGKYTGEEFKNAVGETTWFEERLVGSDWLVSPNTKAISKTKGEAAVSVTVDGKISSGEFMFYYYNPIDNILTIAKNYGKIQTGRLTAYSTIKESVKISGSNYSFGFNGLYPVLTSFDEEFTMFLVSHLEAGQNNVQYLTVDGNIVFYAKYGSSLPKVYPFVILSTRPEILISLLGITETKYNNNLTDGFYLRDGYVTAAALNLTTGKWELAYIEGVSTEYNFTDEKFDEIVDVATLGKYADITDLAAKKQAEYDAGRKVLGWTDTSGTMTAHSSGAVQEGLYIVVESEDSIYIVTDIDTVNASGDYIVDRCQNEDGLTFSATGRTNKITSSSDEYIEPARVTTNENTVIAAICPYGVEVSKGVRHTQDSLYEPVTFYYATDDLIVYTTDADVVGWYPESKDYYVVLSNYSVEFETEDEEEYTLTISGLFNLYTEMADDIVIKADNITDLKLITDKLAVGEIFHLDGVFDIVEGRDYAAAVADILSGEGYEKVTVTDWDSGTSIAIPELGLTAEDRINSIDAKIITLDLWDKVYYDWEDLDPSSAYINCEVNDNYDKLEKLFGNFDTVEIGEKEYVWGGLDMDDIVVEITEPTEGILSNIEIYGYSLIVPVYDGYDDEVVIFDLGLSYAAKYDDTSNELDLIVIKTIENHTCTFGEWVVTTPATETSKGEKCRICKGCGAEDTEEIPMIVANDFDSDGKFGLSDVLMVIRAALNDKNLEGADANGDGKITLIDVIHVLKAIM